MKNSPIREKLAQITENPKLEDDVKVRQLEALGLIVLPEPPSWKSLQHHNLVNINCFAYVCGLGESNTYRQIALADAFKKTNRHFASSDFMRWMIAQNRLSVVEQPEQGDVIVYFQDGAPKHAGIVIDPITHIHSKLGSLPFFEHDIWQVPVTYGTDIQFFKTITPEKGEEAFIGYIDSLNADDEPS